MDQSLAKSLGQQNNKLYLLLAVLVLLSLPVWVLLFGSTVKLNVLPEDARSRLKINLISGVAIPYLDKQLLLSPSAMYELDSFGYHKKQIIVDKESLVPEVLVEMSPLPGIVEVEIVTREELSWRVLGTSLSFTAKSRLIELPQGPATFAVEGSGLEPLIEEVIIEGKGARQRVVLEPKEVSAMVRFSVEPKNAVAFLNGSELTAVDGFFSSNLDVGRNEIEVRVIGYETQLKSIEISKSEVLALGSIVLIPKNVKMLLNSVPNAAAVFVNGNFEGETPLEMSVSPLQGYRIMLRKVGFDSIEKVLTPFVGRDIIETFDFSHALRILKIFTSVKAKVLLNGREIGESPVEVEVKEGDLIDVSAEGYAPETILVAASHLKTEDHFIELVRSERKAFVEANPLYEVEGVKFIRLRGAEKFEAIDVESKGVFHRIPDLYVSQSEISQASFAKQTGIQIKAADEALPKTGLSWEAAVKFCNWLSILEGLEPFYPIEIVDGIEIIEVHESADGYRLPTLVEWQYFLKDYDRTGIGSNTGQPNLILQRGMGNLAGREVSSNSKWFFEEYVDEFEGLAPVASFRPNKAGIHDLVGNAREWLHNRTTGVDYYFGAKDGLEHIVVGTSYKTGKVTELNLNHHSSEFFGREDIGFRVVREIR